MNLELTGYEKALTGFYRHEILLGKARGWVQTAGPLLNSASFGTSILGGIEKPGLYIHKGDDVDPDSWNQCARDMVKIEGKWQRKWFDGRIDYVGETSWGTIHIFDAEQIPAHWQSGIEEGSK